MRILIKIAFRNTFRNRRRTLLTLMILVLGESGLILVGGFFDDILIRFREAFIHSQTGHLQINAEGYYKKGASAPFKYLLNNVPLISQEIQKNSHVLYLVPRLKFGGLVSTDETSIAVMAVGVDPILETRMGSFKNVKATTPATDIVQGRDLDPSDPYGVIVGKGLLEALNLKVGDPLSFITTRVAGAIDGANYQIRGAFETSVKEFDDRAMKVNLESAQRLLGVPNQVHSLLVILDETKNTDLVKDQLQAQFKRNNLALPPLELITWEEQGHFYRQSRALLKKIFATVQLIIAVIFLFSIANTINMALFERMREFGTMMAIGNSRRTIFGMIFLEAAFLGLIGSVAGLFMGCGLAQLISAIGIEMPPPPQATSGYIAVISLSPSLLLQTFLIGLIATVLSSLTPGYRASHFRIIQALGYV